MKTVGWPIVISLGVVLVLGVASFFPYYFTYHFALEDLVRRTEMHPYSVDHNMYRTKLTLASLVVAGVIVAIMFFLRKGCKALDLLLYEKVLLWGMFYVGIMAIVTIGGMWLNFTESHDGFDFYYRIGYFWAICTL